MKKNATCQLVCLSLQQISTIETVRSIKKEGGFSGRGFSKGLTATMARTAIFNMAYFGFYHNVKDIIPRSEVSRSPHSNYFFFYCNWIHQDARFVYFFIKVKENKWKFNPSQLHELFCISALTSYELGPT